MSDFKLDTSGVVRFDGGTLGYISWEGLGQLPNGPFVQGYVEGVFRGLNPRGFCYETGSSAPEYRPWRFSDLALETLARITEDCATLARRAAYMVPTDAEQGAITWTQRQNGEISDFPSLTVYLGDDCRVRFQ